jgi:hypothetical protein
MTVLSSDWRQALIEIDREMVRKGGLRAFVEIAWHLVEREGTFESNWHIDQICEELEAISRGENRRLAIAMPPRHMKSLLTAVFWPAWDWIDNPGRRFLYTSYAYDLALRDSEKSRRIMESEWYRDRWGDKWEFVGAQNRKERYANSKGGERITSSVDSKLTGEGGDVIVVDDPHNVREAESEGQRTTVLNWWRESLSSRHNDPRTGVFALIQQRVHYQDLMGYVLENDTAIPWRVLCLPAEFDPAHKYLNPKDPRTVEGELLWPAAVHPGGAQRAQDVARHLRCGGAAATEPDAARWRLLQAQLVPGCQQHPGRPAETVPRVGSRGLGEIPGSAGPRLHRHREDRLQPEPEEVHHPRGRAVA